MQKEFLTPFQNIMILCQHLLQWQPNVRTLTYYCKGVLVLMCALNIWMHQYQSIVIHMRGTWCNCNCISSHAKVSCMIHQHLMILTLQNITVAMNKWSHKINHHLFTQFTFAIVQQTQLTYSNSILVFSLKWSEQWRLSPGTKGWAENKGEWQENLTQMKYILIVV